MREAYRRTRKDGATGIDGVTAADYEKDLEANLNDLLDRMKSGRYFAPPVRRHYIPKADGTKRPLGIPTFEDKVAQRAILMLLEPIYEADFLPCSYGFRPGRSSRGRRRDLPHLRQPAARPGVGRGAARPPRGRGRGGGGRGDGTARGGVGDRGPQALRYPFRPQCIRRYAGSAMCSPRGTLTMPRNYFLRSSSESGACSQQYRK